MEAIKSRINKRQKLINKLEIKQEQDFALLTGSSFVEDLTLQSPNKIMKVVFSVLGVNAKDVFKRHKSTGLVNRKRDNVQARFAYFYYYKKYGKKPISLSKIGLIIVGDKIIAKYDHSSVIHGCKSWSDWCETDKDVFKKAKKIDLILNTIT